MFAQLARDVTLYYMHTMLKYLWGIFGKLILEVKTIAKVDIILRFNC